QPHTPLPDWTYPHRAHRDPDAFPTRRSSDLEPGGIDPCQEQSGGEPEGVGEPDLPRGPPAGGRGWPGRPARRWPRTRPVPGRDRDRKSTRLNSSHVKISYAVFCLKKKKY